MEGVNGEVAAWTALASKKTAQMRQ